MVQSPQEDEPKTIKEALSNFARDKWKMKMEKEID